MMEAIFNWDAGILLWIQEYVRNDFLTPIVKFITHLGDDGIVWIAILLAFLITKKTRKTGILGAVTLLMTFLINNQIIKPLVARIRPYELVEGLTILIEKPGEFSFPSGHTANSVCVGVFLWLVAMYGVKWKEEGFYCSKRDGWLCLILSVLIGLSRLYVGVHYPTDVIGGMIIGAGIACMVFYCYKMVLIKRKNKNK